MFASIIPTSTLSFALPRVRSVEARSHAKGIIQGTILSRAEAVSLVVFTGLDSGLHLLSAVSKLPFAAVNLGLGFISPNLLGERFSFHEIGHHLAMSFRSILAIFFDIPRIVIRPDLATSYYIERGIISQPKTLRELLEHTWKHGKPHLLATAIGLGGALLTAPLIFSRFESGINSIYPFDLKRLIPIAGIVTLLAGLCLCRGCRNLAKAQQKKDKQGSREALQPATSSDPQSASASFVHPRRTGVAVARKASTSNVFESRIRSPEFRKKHVLWKNPVIGSTNSQAVHTAARLSFVPTESAAAAFGGGTPVMLTGGNVFSNAAPWNRLPNVRHGKEVVFWTQPPNLNDVTGMIQRIKILYAERGGALKKTAEATNIMEQYNSFLQATQCVLSATGQTHNPAEDLLVEGSPELFSLACTNRVRELKASVAGKELQILKLTMHVCSILNIDPRPFRAISKVIAKAEDKVQKLSMVAPEERPAYGTPIPKARLRPAKGQETKI